jgi:DNA-binding transcriptional MerR regulator
MGDTMAFFTKKPEYEPLPWVAPAPPTLASPMAAKYGIADAIALMRSLPDGQDGDLVIQVVRATLASLKVQLPDIIEDAAKKQLAIQERIDQGHAQIAKLEEKLEEHRREIAAQMADLKETEEVKARLERAELVAEKKPPVAADNKPETPVTALT